MSHYRILCPPAPPRNIPWWSQPYEIKLRYADGIDLAQVFYNGILDLICWGLWIITVFKRGGVHPLRFAKLWGCPCRSHHRHHVRCIQNRTEKNHMTPYRVLTPPAVVKPAAWWKKPYTIETVEPTKMSPKDQVGDHLTVNTGKCGCGDQL